MSSQTNGSGGTASSTSGITFRRWQPKRSQPSSTATAASTDGSDGSSGSAADDVIAAGLRRCTALLSKLTVEKFEVIKEQLVTQLEDAIRSGTSGTTFMYRDPGGAGHELAERVGQLIVVKAINEPMFASLYVRLIIELHNRLNPMEDLAIALPDPASVGLKLPAPSSTSTTTTATAPSYIPVHVLRTAAITSSLTNVLIPDLIHLIDVYASPFVDLRRSVATAFLQQFDDMKGDSALTTSQQSDETDQERDYRHRNRQYGLIKFMSELFSCATNITPQALVLQCVIPLLRPIANLAIGVIPPMPLPHGFDHNLVSVVTFFMLIGCKLDWSLIDVNPFVTSISPPLTIDACQPLLPVAPTPSSSVSTSGGKKEYGSEVAFYDTWRMLGESVTLLPMARLRFVILDLLHLRQRSWSSLLSSTVIQPPRAEPTIPAPRVIVLANPNPPPRPRRWDGVGVGDGDRDRDRDGGHRGESPPHVPSSDSGSGSGVISSDLYVEGMLNTGIRRCNALLSKLTPERFDTICDQLVAYLIEIIYTSGIPGTRISDHADDFAHGIGIQLAEKFAEQIVAKAISEPMFAAVHVRLITALHQRLNPFEAVSSATAAVVPVASSSFSASSPQQASALVGMPMPIESKRTVVITTSLTGVLIPDLIRVITIYASPVIDVRGHVIHELNDQLIRDTHLDTLLPSHPRRRTVFEMTDTEREDARSRRLKGVLKLVSELFMVDPQPFITQATLLQLIQPVLFPSLAHRIVRDQRCTPTSAPGTPLEEMKFTTDVLSLVQLITAIGARLDWSVIGVNPFVTSISPPLTIDECRPLVPIAPIPSTSGSSSSSTSTGSIVDDDGKQLPRVYGSEVAFYDTWRMLSQQNDLLPTPRLRFAILELLRVRDNEWIRPAATIQPARPLSKVPGLLSQ